MVSWLGHRAHYLLVEPEHEPCAAVRHEPHFARLTRLESHGGSSRNVEAISDGFDSIERERGVRLGEMKVTANLNRPVAGVRDRDNEGGPVRIQENLASSGKKFPGYHVSATSIATMPPHAAIAPAARNAALGIALAVTRHSPMPAA